MPCMVSYHRLKSGHITCYLNRTYHVLLTHQTLPLDASARLVIPLRQLTSSVSLRNSFVLGGVRFLGHRGARRCAAAPRGGSSCASRSSPWLWLACSRPLARKALTPSPPTSSLPMKKL